MKIKSFIAPNIEKALAQIRKEMGSSALILETRECEGRGFKGFLGKTLVEVIAACPEDVAMEGSEEGAGCSGEKQEAVAGGILEDSYEGVSNDKDISKGVSGDAAGKISRPKMLALLNERIKGKKDIKLDVGGPEIKKQDIKPEPSDTRPEVVPEAIDKVKADNVNLPHFEIERLRIDLMDQDVRKETIDLLLDHWTNGKMAEMERIDINKIKIDVRCRIAGMISVKSILGNSHEPCEKKTITFVGPTGVGKTTTLAKVAAKLAIDYKKNVGVITIDTYRIAAVDQLMAYAEMIDIPVRVAHTSKQLSMAVNEFNDKDFILIDTVGRSQYDEKRIRMLRGLLKILPSSENYLVISAGTRNREADDIFANFNILPLHGFIFTKIDETKSFGMLLNMIIKTKIPIYYLTNGQEVPDDILEASPDGIADMVLPCNELNSLTI